MKLDDIDQVTAVNPTMNETLNAQQEHWEVNYSFKREMFGESRSDPAQQALVLFKREATKMLLELGGGQGQDTFFFARNGIKDTVLDYSQIAVDTINSKAKALRVADRIRALQHDVRVPLPFGDNTFDACYSHMLFCMPLTTEELVRLSAEVLRVLKPGGLHVYTVRHTGDPHYGTGIHRGEDMYEVGGSIVHFFDRAKVELLAEGYEIVSIDEFEEGGLPRKLFRITLRRS
jgi:SAM-dependent methyltransferase